MNDHLSLGEGNTPILALSRLGDHLDLPSLAAKAEWLSPTGSYKDRIALETMRDALRTGCRGWIGTSSGNGGAAMAAYGSRAGLAGVLCVAADAPQEKLMSILPYDVTLMPMTSLGSSEMDALEVLAREHRFKLSITAYRYNPEGMLGAETIGREIISQGSFTHVYVPAGGGGLLVAIARGMMGDATHSGHIGKTQEDSIPRIICVQPGGCSPIVECLEGSINEPIVGECNTTISGLQLPAPPDGDAAVAAVRATRGWGTAVHDTDAWRAQELLAKMEGIFVEPASATTLAAIIADQRAGRLRKGDRPLAVLTGSGLKDLRRTAERLALPTSSVDMDAVRAFLRDFSR